jgi:hypothetical protein
MGRPTNVIFWGAGATAALGIRATKDQTKFLRHITGASDTDNKPLSDRVKESLDLSNVEPWYSALFDQRVNHPYAILDHCSAFSAVFKNHVNSCVTKDLRVIQRWLDFSTP